MAMVKLIEPKDEGELALIKSLLDANGIVHFVLNENSNALTYGNYIPCSVVVDESKLEEAHALLSALTSEDQ